MSLRRSPEERAELVAAFRRSGLSQRAFSAREGIKLTALQLGTRPSAPEPGAHYRALATDPSTGIPRERNAGFDRFLTRTTPCCTIR
jgi:hypothetical protein